MYIRSIILAASIAAFATMAQAQCPQGSTNISLGKPVNVSSFVAGHPGSSGNDGNFSTWWQSKPVSPSTPFEFFVVNLGASYAFNEFFMRWHPSYFPAIAEIDGSNDGMYWTGISQIGGHPSFDLILPNGSPYYRYIRIALLSGYASLTRAYALDEFSICGHQS